MVQVKSCCCGCCTLEQGTGIIAVICIIYYSVALLFGCIYLAIMLTDADASEQIYPGFHKYETAFKIQESISLFLAIVGIVLAGCLLAGSISRNVRLCLPWLYWHYVYFVLKIIITILLVVLLTLTEHFGEAFGYAFWYSIWIAVLLYLILVVQSFVMELR